MQIEAVIFDMDGLMLDTERLGSQAWLAAAAELGVAMEEAAYHRLIGLNRKDSGPILRELIGDAGDVAAYQERAHSIYMELVAGPVPCKAGLFELLDYIEARGLPKGVATSTGAEMARKKLINCGILHRFDALATGNEVERGKPHPEIFQLCALRLGVDITRCVVLEDSPNGIRAAHAAGAHVIMIPDMILPTDELREKTNAILPSLCEVPGYLEELEKI